MFDFLRRNAPEHLKRADKLLHEAHLARLEHEAAAEHHAALAEMYAKRVTRLEREVHAARALAWPTPPSGAMPELEEAKVHLINKPERAEMR